MGIPQHTALYGIFKPHVMQDTALQSSPHPSLLGDDRLFLVVHHEKSISFIAHCEMKRWENRPLPAPIHFKQGPANPEEAAWSFRKGLGGLCFVGRDAEIPGGITACILLGKSNNHMSTKATGNRRLPLPWLAFTEAQRVLHHSPEVPALAWASALGFPISYEVPWLPIVNNCF